MDSLPFDPRDVWYIEVGRPGAWRPQKRFGAKPTPKRPNMNDLNFRFDPKRVAVKDRDLNLDRLQEIYGLPDDEPEPEPELQPLDEGVKLSVEICLAMKKFYLVCSKRRPLQKSRYEHMAEAANAIAEAIKVGHAGDPG